jgi:hypothetical protein
MVAMTRNGILLAFVLTSSPVATTAVRASSAFSFVEEPGDFAVGFKVVQQYDETRVFLAPSDP